MRRTIMILPLALCAACSPRDPNHVPLDDAASGDDVADANDGCGSAGGELVFSTDRDGDSEIAKTLPEVGDVETLTDNTGVDSAPVWSPDGERIAWRSDVTGDSEIYTMRADGSELVNVTNDPAHEDGLNSFAWSPDSARVVFMSARAGNNEIFVVNADGTGLTNLSQNSASDTAPTWAPGADILFSSRRDGNNEIYRMAPDGSNQTRLTNSPDPDQRPRWSPDGTRIVYEASVDGQFDLVVINADGSASVNLFEDANSQLNATWSPDQNVLYYLEGSGGTGLDVWSVDVATRVKVNLTQLFTAYHNDLDITPDGRRLIFTSDRFGNNDIYSMRPDGSDVANLTSNPANDMQPGITACRQ